jgi:type II secretory pathway component GspD/PulD (secretin)
VQTTLTPDVGSQTSLKPGTITVGFTANVLPTIMSDNRIMLQYQMNSSSLLGLRTFTSGDNSIQLPELFSQSLQQQAYLNDGDVLVLFGFEQDRSQINEVQGVIAAGRGSTQNKVTTAVVIQVRAARL